MTDREKFEAWAVTPESWCQGIERHGDSYKAVATAASWVAFQAGICSAATPAPAQPEGEKTGWPPGMLQDDDRKLSRALADTPHARAHADEAAAAIRADKHERCEYCDDTGDVNSIDGEWRGRCTCEAGAAAPDEGEARGVEKAARWVDRRRDEYEDEHGTVDPETGSLEFGRGPSGQAKRDYVETLWEIAEGIRALPAAPKEKP